MSEETRASTDSPARPILYRPPGAREAFSTVCGLWGLCSLIGDAFDFREYDPEETISVGDLKFSFAEVPHYIQTWAIEVSVPGKGRITYGADCRPNGALVEFARETDVLIAEATLPRPERHHSMISWYRLVRPDSTPSSIHFWKSVIGGSIVSARSSMRPAATETSCFGETSM